MKLKYFFIFNFFIQINSFELVDEFILIEQCNLCSYLNFCIKKVKANKYHEYLKKYDIEKLTELFYVNIINDKFLKNFYEKLNKKIKDEQPRFFMSRLSSKYIIVETLYTKKDKYIRIYRKSYK